MNVSLQTVDIAIILIYIMLVFGVGAAMSRRASRSTEQFFVSGRSLPWWIVGTSMVATTFAADTPLVVSGLVARGGIYQNWLWWHWGIGGIVAVFLFSRLWRRAGITTDAELIELRYDGRPAAALRCYRAVWFGILQNVLIIAWVMRAMAKIVIVIMGWDDSVTVLGMNAEVFTVLCLFVIAVSYTALSGLWGVVMTDVLQFILAMGGAVYLAAVSLARLGGIEGVRRGIAAKGFSVEETFRIIPEAADLTAANPFTEFCILILVIWWASYQIEGPGYLAQRLFAAKNERHSVLGYLWFSIAHICLRPWPWIAVGLCGMAMFGAVEDPETYYPMMMRTVLPPGIFGLVTASFFAAFMSTIDTQLNWGSSLVINDLLRRFIWKGRSEREYIVAARMSVIGLAVLGAVASFAVTDISFAWKLILSVTAGIGSVYIARWYWWRVNAWSEVSAMAAAIVCTVIFAVLSRLPRFEGNPLLGFPYSTALTVLVSVPTWITVTMLTRPVGREHLVRFYKRVKPGGRGWKPIYRELPDVYVHRSGVRTLIGIAAGITALFSALMGVGRLVMSEHLSGFMLLGIAIVSGAVLFVSLKE
jgi:Na+/proline symporter